MYRYLTARLVLAGIIVLSVTPARAFLPPKQTPLPNVDPPAAVAGEAATPEQQSAAAELRSQLPQARVDFDRTTGSPKMVSAGDGLLTGPGGQGAAMRESAFAGLSADDPHRVTKAFLQQHRKLFGFGPEALGKARVKREFTASHNGLKTVVWEQQVEGIPVFEGVLVSHTTKNGALVNLSSRFVRDPSQASARGNPNSLTPAAAPAIAAAQATALAAQNLGEDAQAAAVTAATEPESAPEKNQKFKAPFMLGESDTKLTWLPTDGETLRLCWDVILTSRKRGEMFRVLVDAQTGEVRVRHNLTTYISDATYNVFTSDSPSPLSPGYSTPQSVQPPLVNRSLVTLQAINTTASPNGWIDDGGNETVGNNVDAHTDRNNDNSPDLPRPQGLPTRVFNFSMDLTTQDPTNYSQAAVVQLFYWNNWMHDKLYELGFTEAAGNFQTSNFGRGGLGSDAVQADAQDGGGTDNANFSTPPDGSPGRMQMYIFTGPNPRRDGDLDAEVVLHEYTHGLSNRRVGGGVGMSALQSEGMGEGWSDFYALSLLSEPGDNVNGCYASGGYASYLLSAGFTTNYYFGIRRYPYTTDMSKNPLTFKDIDPSQASPHTGIPRSSVIGNTANEVHNMGEVWCVTLWEARANLITKLGYAAGNHLILQLVTDGMNLSPANPNFLQARDAILQADVVDNGGANRTELWAAFAKRGMGISATSPGSSSTSGLVEAYDVPDNLSVIPTVSLTSTGPVGGPFTPNPAYFSLANVGSNSLSWALGYSSPYVTVSPSSGTLTPGGAGANVAVTVNPVALTLPLGMYPTTIRFTNQTSGAVQSRVFNLAVVGRSMFDDFEPGIDLSQWSSFGGVVGSTVLATNYGGSISSPNSLWFGDAGSRFAATLPINTSAGGTISFYIRLADGSAWPWEMADALPGEGVVLESSVDSGANWTQIGNYDTTAYYVWTAVTLPIPVAAQSGATQFRWRQLSHSGSSYDHWALDNVTIDAGPTPPSIMTQPASLTVPVGWTASFSVLATGSTPLAYQWRFNGADLSGATTNPISLPNVQSNQAGFYSVVVTNQYGSVTSSAAQMVIADRSSLIAVFTDPTYIDMTSGGTSSEGVNVKTTLTNLGYQIVGFTNIVAAAAANSVLLFPEQEMRNLAPYLSTDDKAALSYFVSQGGLLVVHGGEGGAGSLLNTALGLSVVESSQISGGPSYSLTSQATGTVFAGGPASVPCNNGTSTLTGLPVGSLSIYENAGSSAVALIPYGSGTIVFLGFDWYNAAPLGTQDGGWVAVLGRAVMARTSMAPSIVTQPANTTAVVGDTATLTVLASGSAPLSYQWHMDGTNLPGATTATLILPSVQFSQAGTYSVQVTNAYGVTNSADALLTVSPPPPCAAPPLGLVGWWRGESNTVDTVGGNNGTITGGVTYSGGRVGLGFQFNGSDGQINFGPAIGNFGTNAFSVEFWIRTTSTRKEAVLNKRNVCNADSFFDVLIQGGKVGLSVDGGANSYGFLGVQDPRVIADGALHHAVVVRQGATLFTYVDGTFGSSATHSSGQVAEISNASGLLAGKSPCVGIDGTQYFTGMLDEISLYDRALTAVEIQALYAAERTGKCVVPTGPKILQQPAALVAIAGDSPTLTVVAAGTPPISYQWRYNGTNLAGATTSSLTLTNAQLTDSGTYSVFLSNSVDTLLSSNAIVTVTPPPPCAPPPLGLVAWWRAEDDGSDSVGTNTAALINGVGFSKGMAGRAFDFDGVDDRVVVADAPELDVSTNDFSIEAWINPKVSATTFGIMTLVCHRYAPDTLHSLGYEFALVDGRVVARLSTSIAADGESYGPAGPDLRDGTFHHVAMTVERNSAVGGRFYVDGQVVLTFNPTGESASLSTTEPLRIGNHATPSVNCYFKGQMDEVSLYARALSEIEVRSIYNGERSGKCAAPTPPAILLQPISQVVTAQDSVTFSVIAAGSAPMSYQWKFNGTNLASATASSLALTNTKVADSGSYTILLSNSVNTLLSSNAVLTVMPAPPCAAPVPGLVSWWQGENSAADVAGGNNGTVAGSGTFGYARGVVGQAFVSDGIHRDRVDLGNPASLQLQNFTIEMWVKRTSTSQVSLDDNNEDGSISGEGGIVFGYGRNGYGFGLLNNGLLVLSRIDVDGVYSTGVVTDTNWHHVAVSKGGATSAFYIDGKPASGPLSYVTTFTFTESAAIGSRGDARGGTFWGMIDEPAVYNRALSAVEVAAIYNAERSGKCVVPTPPTILLQPTNCIATAGDSLNLYVIAAGTQPISYQWRLNGTNVAGATTSSLVFTNALVSDSGTYTVFLSNSVDTLLSSNALVTVNPPPPCAAPPVGLISWWRGENDASDPIGGNHGVVNNGLLFVPGRVGRTFAFDGVNQCVRIPYSPTLAVTNYSVEAWVNPLTQVSDSISQDMIFGQNFGVMQMVARTGLSGVRIAFQFGTSKFTFYEVVSTVEIPIGQFSHLLGTWDGNALRLYINGTLNAQSIPGATPVDSGCDYFIGGAITSTGGYCDYVGQFFNGLIDEASVYGRALSPIEVQALYAAERSGKCATPTPPTILLQPADQVVTVRSNAMFNVVAAGTSPLAYQWRRNQNPLGGETNATLFLSAVATNQAGSYDVVITNTVGVATSTVAVLTVYTPPAPVFTIQPAGRELPAGTNYTLSGMATDVWPIVYQWYLGGAAIPGATGNTLTLMDVQSTNAGTYTLAASNPWSTAMSDPATVTVIPVSPAFTLQPRSSAVFRGFPVRLDVAASGTEPLSYQWQFHGTNLPGATGTSYTVTNMMPENVGSYQVIATNSVGQTPSTEAVLALSPVVSLGSSTLGLMALPIEVTNAVAVSAGAQHNLVLRRDGRVAAWGAGLQIVIPDGLTNVVTVAAGSDHSVALRADGSVAAWGGLNTAGQTNVPTGLTNAVAIAAGASHSLALRANGTVVAWGLNSSGQTTVPTALTNVVAIAAGSNHSIALRADGKVFAWGNNTYGQTSVPGNLADVVAIAAGALHNLALRSDGTVAAWGPATYSRTNVPAGLSNVVAIAAGGFHSLAIKADGSVVTWGAGTNSVPTAYPNLAQAFIPAAVTNIVAVSGGDAHTLALAGDGAPFIIAPPMGRFSYSGRRVVFQAAATGAQPLSYQWRLGGADIPGATSQWLVMDTALDSGDYRVVASNALGVATSPPATLTLVDSAPLILAQPVGQPAYLGSQTLLQVTADGSGPLSYQWRLNGTNIDGATGSSLMLTHVILSQGGSYSVVVSNAFGAVSSTKAAVPVVQAVAWGAGTNYSGGPSYGQSIIPAGLNTAVAMAGGGYHTLAVKAGGNVIAWGAGTNLYGSTPNYNQSIVPAGLPAVTGVAGGLYHSLAVRADGLVSAWGAGTSNYVSPHYGQSVVPAGLSNVVAVAAGDYHSVALKSDGKVAAWGYTSYAITNVPPTVSNVVAIASRANHALALRSDGSVVHWGSSTALPPTPYNYVAIAVGTTHCLALRNDGTVVTWNSGYPVPTGLSNVVDIAAGFDHSLALKNDGTVVTWGATNTYGRNLVPPGLTNVIGIACGYYNSMAFLGDGSPLIKFPPANRAAYLGSTTNFSVMALGAQPLRYQWQCNGTDIPGATNASLTLTNLHASDAGNYRVVVTNVFNSVTSAVASLTVLVPIGEAVDAPGLVWSTSGNAAWAGEAAVTHDGLDAAQSGLLIDNQSSTVQTTVNGPGNLSFWWKVSSEEWFDYLSFYLDGLKQTGISGNVDWQMLIFPVGAGTHTLRWTYAKDVSVSVGADAGWLDQVLFLTNPPVITLHPVSQKGGMGATLVLTAAATGATPITYQWSKDGTNIAGATTSIYVISTATRRDSGAYRVVASNGGGGTPSSNATLVVRSPQRLGQPVRLPGGIFGVTCGDADGGPLVAGDLPNFQVQATTNFVDWKAVLNCLTVTNGMLLLTDPASTNYPLRFYRIIELDDAFYATHPPGILLHPVSQTVDMGARLELTVAAEGAPPLRYQWMKGGITLSGATTTSLVITNATRRNSGEYWALVSNPVGLRASGTATVVVRVLGKFEVPLRLPDGTFILTARDADGGGLSPADLSGFQAQISSNLVDWVPLSNSLTVTNGLLLLRDTTGTNGSTRFYRILEP